MFHSFRFIAAVLVAGAIPFAGAVSTLQAQVRGRMQPGIMLPIRPTPFTAAQIAAAQQMSMAQRLGVITQTTPMTEASSAARGSRARSRRLSRSPADGRRAPQLADR